MNKVELSKDNAWEIFEKASGKSRDAHKIERSKGCWVIRKLDKDSIAVGEAPWVVADSGKAIRVGYPLSLEAVLAEVARFTDGS